VSKPCDICKDFQRQNISLFYPKKDQCDICCSYDTWNLAHNDYVEHIARKEEARLEKKHDKERAIANSDMKVITVDSQAVLLSPVLQASAVYYMTRLACHNYTICNKGRQNNYTFGS